MSPPASLGLYGLWAGLLTGRVRSVRRPMSPYAGGFRPANGPKLSKMESRQQPRWLGQLRATEARHDGRPSTVDRSLHLPLCMIHPARERVYGLGGSGPVRPTVRASVPPAPRASSARDLHAGGSPPR